MNVGILEGGKDGSSGLLKVCTADEPEDDQAVVFDCLVPFGAQPGLGGEYQDNC